MKMCGESVCDQAATRALAEVSDLLRRDYPGCTVQLFSSLKKTGVEDAERVLANWLDIEIKKAENKGPPDKGDPGAKMP